MAPTPSPLARRSTGNGTRWLVVGAVILAFAVGFYLFRPGEERRVRARLDAIAQTLGTPEKEADMGRLTRLAQLRAALTEDATVYFDKDERQPVRGRDEIAGLASAALTQFGPIRVELRDVRITLRSDAPVADVYMEVRVVARDSKAEQPALEARRVSVTLKEFDTTWRVASARILPQDDTLRAP
jgi:ketosteroid isomerase-like protein